MSDVSWAQMLRVFLRIGLLSFGGPAAQIALMHRELVEQRPWLSEKDYLSALSFCMLLPGPEAMQLATYSGWRLKGVAGGLLAGGLFVLPGAIVMVFLALAYLWWGQLDIIQAVFLGVKACVVVIVLNALRKVALKSLSGTTTWVLAIASFAALFVGGVPFPLVILAAGLFGFWVKLGVSPAPDNTTAIPKLPPISGLIRTIGIFGAVWIAPIALVVLWDQPFLLDIALFFSKLAVVTFGGAYAVLAYITQAMVNDYGWITTAQMIDGLGLAETTPGPLILVTEFVAIVAGVNHAGAGMGLAAGVLALWVTFVPCFLWIFAGAPYLEWIRHQPRLAGAMAAITAAIVGVIMNLTLWFAAHVFFDELSLGTWAGLSILMPTLSSINLTATALAAIAGVALFWRKWDMVWVLLMTALLGGVFYLFG